MLNNIKNWLSARKKIENTEGFLEWSEEMNERGALDVDYMTPAMPIKRRWETFKPYRKNRVRRR